MGHYSIRQATASDAERLIEIYSYYVLNTAVSFEYEVPGIEEFRRRIESTGEKYPFLICIVDDKIVGYAYANAYSIRKAYSWTVSMSIYMDKDYRRQGAGRALYEEMEKKLKAMGIRNLLAGVAYSENEDAFLTHDSYLFHLKSGYTKVAHMKSVGKKFDNWYDLLWMQKMI